MNALAIINEALLQEQLYKLSSTQINLPAAHADYIVQWGRTQIPDTVLYYDDKGGLGRETEIHITLLYGIKEKELNAEALALLTKTPPFTVRLTRIGQFTNEKYDVVYIEVFSQELEELNAALRQVCDHESTHPKFHPHVTIAYVKPGSCNDLAGLDPFTEFSPGYCST